MKQEPSTATVIASELLAALDDPEDLIRRKAMSIAFARLNPLHNSALVIAALLKGLRDDDWHVRNWAARSIPRIGAQNSPAVVEGIVQLLTHPQNEVRCHVVAEIPNEVVSCKPVFNALIQLLQDPDPQLRRAALGKIGVGKRVHTAARIIDRIALLLEDPDSGVVYSAILAIGRLAPQVATHEPICQKLLSLLEHANRYVVLAAAHVLGGGEPVLTALAARLQDPDPRVRGVAAEVVCRLGRQSADPLLSHLFLLLKDSNEDVVFTTAHALSRLDRDESIQNALLEGLEDPNAKVRKIFVPVVFCQLRSQFNIRSQRIRNAVVAALRDPDPGVRRTAVGVLGRDVTRSKVVLGELIERLQDSDTFVRLEAMLAVCNLRLPTSEPVVNAIVSLLVDANSMVVWRVLVRVMGRLKIPDAYSRTIRQTLTRLIQHHDPYVVQAARRAMQSASTRLRGTSRPHHRRPETVVSSDDSLEEVWWGLNSDVEVEESQ